MTRPLEPIAKAFKFSKSIEAEGVEYNSDEWLYRVNEFFARETDERCKCGAKKKYFECGGTLCQRCYLATLEVPDPTRDDLMGKIGVPPSYRHCTLAAYKGIIEKEVATWILSPTTNLIIWGKGTGVGKTHLGTAALYSASQGGHRCWWASASELARELSDEVFDDDKVALRKSSNVEILLIDDLGNESKVVPRASEMIQDVLDRRFRHGKATIVTTNLNEEELEAYSHRVASRLLGGALVIHKQGDDRRV